MFGMRRTLGNLSADLRYTILSSFSPTIFLEMFFERIVEELHSRYSQLLSLFLCHLLVWILIEMDLRDFESHLDTLEVGARLEEQLKREKHQLE